MGKLSREDLVYKVSRWQRYLYDSERDHNKGLQAAEKDGRGRANRYPDYQRELFSRLYNPRTKKLDEPAADSEWAQKLHGTAEGVPEFKVLQDRCKGDEVWSGMATTTLSKQVSATMEKRQSKEDIPDLERRVQGLSDLMSKGVQVGKRLKAAQKRLEKAKAEAQEMAEGLDPVALRQAIRKGCEQAQEEIGEMDKAVESFSYGTEPGAPARLGNAEAKRKLAKRIKASPKLSKIAELAGRLRRVAAEKQRSKASDSRSEVTDIEQGNEIDRLLPSELMDLLNGGGGERELMFYSRFLDRQCLQYKLSGKEKEGRGPIVICMDESGSMGGDREVWAKAVALALLEVANRQKRTWAFVHFDTRVTRTDVVPHGKIDTAALMDCMEHFSGGGTSFQAPLDQAVEIIRGDSEMKKADVLLVTDGYCSTSDDWDKTFARKKEELSFQVFSVMVAMGGGSYGSVEKWSNQIFPINELLEDKFHDVMFSV